jgi:hypothetical protein
MPQRAEPTVKTIKPILYILVRPNISASLPKRGKKMVRVSIYAIATHSIIDIGTTKLCSIVGIATLTILTSRADIVAPTRTVDSINHFQFGWEEKYG